MFSALKKIWAPVVNSDEDEAKEREELGITEELIQLVDNISRFTESFRDFPYQTLKDPSLKMTKIQKRHVQKILEIVKPLNDLRFQMCPSVMNDEKFWRIYFAHIQVVSKGMFINTTPTATSSTTSKQPTDFLDELDSQFDRLSNKKKPFDEGISEEEDSYFSPNTYVLQSSSSSTTTIGTPNKNKPLQIGNSRPITVSASSPPPPPTSSTNTTTTTTINIQETSPKTDNNLIDTNFDNINNSNIEVLSPEQRNIELDKNIDNFLNPS